MKFTRCRTTAYGRAEECGNAICPQRDQRSPLEHSDGGGRGGKDHAQADRHRDEHAAGERQVQVEGEAHEIGTDAVSNHAAIVHTNASNARRGWRRPLRPCVSSATVCSRRSPENSDSRLSGRSSMRSGRSP